MNVFVVNECPKISGHALLDKHVIKMPLETAQLLCTVARKRGFEAPYKSTHANHPATLWLGQSSSNWNWLCEHGLAMSEEYTYRYGKVHKCQAIIQMMKDRTLEIWGDNAPYTEHTPFVQCMPDEFKRENPIEGYQAYYMGAKSEIAKWKIPSTKPDWFIL